MPERRFDTAYWSNPFVMKLTSEAKLLYAYLWTNLHCNQAGLYEIAPKTIGFETGLALEDIPELLNSLEPKVAWYPEHNLVWVKNFLRHQTKSPQFLVAAAKCLESINNNSLVRDFLEYNQKYNLSIPYQYPKDRVAVSDSDTPPHAHANTHADAETEEKLGVVKGEEESSATNRESRTATGKPNSRKALEFPKLLSFLETLKGWRFVEADDLAWLKEFSQEWPEFDLPLAKACRDYHSGREPPKHKGQWKNRFREWMRHEHKFAEERRDRGEQPRHRPARARGPLKYIRGSSESGEEGEADMP